MAVSHSGLTRRQLYRSQDPTPRSGITYLKTVALLEQKMDLSNVQDGTMNINLLGCKGRTFAWIVQHRADVIVWAQRKVPECSTDLFRLVQYEAFHRYGADVTRMERRWTRLRAAHHEHMRRLQQKRHSSCITPTDVNGHVKKRKLNQEWDKFGFT